MSIRPRSPRRPGIHAPLEDQVKKIDDTAIGIMYHALLMIDCATSEYSPLHPLARYMRAQEIASDALRRMNTEHTKEVQKILGIGK